MQRTIIIAPIKREKGTTVFLQGKYTHPKTGIINILTNGRTVLRECEPGEKTKDIMINDNNPEFVFKWDDVTDAEKIMEAKAWSRNPTVDCPGNDNLVRAMFRLVDKTEKVKADILTLKEKGRVYNIINNMPVKKMRDIAFFVGLNPIFQSPEEIFISLVDFQNGALMKTPKQFLNNYTTPDMEYIVVAKKAILYGVIITKERQYYNNTELIGSSFEDVLAYCKANTEQYEGFIRKEVAKVDVLPVNIDYDKPVDEVIGTLKKEEKKPELKEDIKKVVDDHEKAAEADRDAELDELRVIAKGLKIKGFHLMGRDTLIGRIENVKKQEFEPVNA